MAIYILDSLCCLRKYLITSFGKKIIWWLSAIKCYKLVLSRIRMIKDVLAEMYTPGSQTRLSILLSSIFYPVH